MSSQFPIPMYLRTWNFSEMKARQQEIRNCDSFISKFPSCVLWCRQDDPNVGKLLRLFLGEIQVLDICYFIFIVSSGKVKVETERIYTFRNGRKRERKVFFYGLKIGQMKRDERVVGNFLLLLLVCSMYNVQYVQYTLMMVNDRVFFSCSSVSHLWVTEIEVNLMWNEYNM